MHKRRRNDSFGKPALGAGSAASVRTALRILAFVLLATNSQIGLGEEEVESADPRVETIEQLKAEMQTHYRSDRYELAEQKARELLKLREEVYGPKHPDLATSLNNLGTITEKLGRFDEAEKYYLRALQIREAALGPEHIDIVDSFYDLGDLYQKTDRFPEAESLYRRALAMVEKLVPTNHGRTAQALNRLAGRLDAQGQYKEAEKLYERMLDVVAAVFGPEHWEMATSLNNLAGLYEKTARYRKAEALYRKALSIREKAHGAESAKVVVSMRDLADVLMVAGNFSEAGQLYKQALDISRKIYRPDSTDLAISLADYGDYLFTIAQYENAEALLKQALEISEAHYGKSSSWTASYAARLGHLYSRTARYAEAGSLYDRALAIREQAYGPEHPTVASSLNALANLYKTTGRYPEAEPLYDRALAIREQVYGPDHPSVATSLSNLANLYVATGRYPEAEPLYDRALAIREQVHGPNHPSVATSLGYLADLYKTTGRYPEAEPLYDRALAIREQVYGPNHPSVATSLNDLGGLYETTGRYTEAESLFDRALALREQAYGPEHPTVATSFSYLAGLYELSGRYAEALQLYRQALAISEAVYGPDHPEVSAASNNLANVYESTGRYAEAEPLYKRALAIAEEVYGPIHARVATQLNNLAYLYGVTGRFAEAEPLHRRALKIRKTVYGAEHPDIANSLSNLARVLIEMKQYEEAETHIRQALKIRRQALGESHYRVAQTLNILGELLAKTGRRTEAESMYLRAYEIAMGSETPRILWTIQNNLQLLYQDQSADLSIFFGKQSVNTVQKLRASLSTAERDTQHAYTRKVSGVFDNLANQLIQQGRLLEAQQVLAMLKEEEYFEFLRRDAETDPRQTEASYSTQEAPWAERYARISGQLAQLGGEYKTLARIPASSRSAAQQARYEALQKDLSAARQAFNSYIEELQAAFTRSDSRRAADFGEKQLQSLRALQGTLKRLGPGVVLVHYLVTGDKLHILLTTPDIQLARHSSVSEAELNRQVFAYRQILSQPSDDPLPLAQGLYRHLIAPIHKDLQQAGAQTLLVSLDGALRYLPVSALHSGERWLAEDYAVAVYTAASRNNLGQTSTVEWRVAGLGVSDRASDFSELPSVPYELDDIVREEGGDERGVLPGTVQLNEAFNPQALTEALEAGYPVIHIASHFRFTPGTEIDSFLLTGNDGRLTLADFKTGAYPLHEVDLLTLSACQTAVGDTGGADGREVEGFGALAQNQGAKSVIASLWSVADASTGLFMQRFYRTRGERQASKAQALRQAKLGFIRGEASLAEVPEERRGAGRPRTGGKASYTPDPARPLAHPFYWAPFILMGNPA